LLTWENQQSFGYWLRQKRRTLDLTQEQLAHRVGCSAAAIRKFEAEERRPSAQMARRFAEIFDVAPDEQESFLHFARGDWKSVPTSMGE
jgi:transcriptional regulator with XRE-family HTH domain